MVITVWQEPMPRAAAMTQAPMNIGARGTRSRGRQKGMERPEKIPRPQSHRRKVEIPREDMPIFRNKKHVLIIQ